MPAECGGCTADYESARRSSTLWAGNVAHIVLMVESFFGREEVLVRFQLWALNGLLRCGKEGLARSELEAKGRFDVVRSGDKGYLLRPIGTGGPIGLARSLLWLVRDRRGRQGEPV
jgi:hypothetical protein